MRAIARQGCRAYRHDALLGAVSLPLSAWGRTAVHSVATSTHSVAQTVAAMPAQSGQIGTATGLPVPRYVSLKSDRVNLREGPSKDHRTNWVFQRAGLPVEITAEFETWRKIRDSEGAEGWVLHSLLSGRRTALIFPSRKAESVELLAKAGNRADAVARLAGRGDRHGARLRRRMVPRVG